MLLRVQPHQHLDLANKLSQATKNELHTHWPQTANAHYHQYLLEIPFDLGMHLTENMPQEDFEHILKHFPEVNAFAEAPADAQVK